MQEIKKLKITVAKHESIIVKMPKSGIIFECVLLKRKLEDIVTDRILVSDEAVRVLDVKS